MITMKKIAEKAGVSRSTVSAVLRGQVDVLGIKASTRDKVLSVASELHYHPNELARSMARGHTKVIGYVHRGMSSDYSSRMLEGATVKALELGYFIKHIYTTVEEGSENVIKQSIEQQVAGLICVSMAKDKASGLKDGLRDYPIPITLLDCVYEQDWGIRVVSSDVKGAKLATRHLIDLGHRKIAHVYHYKDQPFTYFRMKGFREAMDEAGLCVPDEYVVGEPGYRVLKNEAYIKKLLTLPSSQRPTAIFCSTDHSAALVLREAWRMGIKVPSELSVVGYADLNLANYTCPALTTIHQPFKGMGAEAVKLLIDRIEGKDEVYLKKNQELPVELVERESCAPISKKQKESL